MLQYINGFSCAVDGERGDVVINFVQQSPVFNEAGDVERTEAESVSKLVMREEMAREIIAGLMEVLGDSELMH